MPCYDGRDQEAAVENEHTLRVLRKHIAGCATALGMKLIPDYGKPQTSDAEIEAMLCAVLSVLDKNHSTGLVLAQINYSESGVTPKRVKAWWGLHKLADNKRKIAEIEAAVLDFPSEDNEA